MKKAKILIIALLLCMSAAPAWAKSTSELLEQAIYAEETVGNLHAAIKLYGQVIKEADAYGADAANALYRQSICYQRLGQLEKSTETLNKLIASYPNQSEIVAKAKASLGKLSAQMIALEPAPWQDGEVLMYSLLSPSGANLAGMTTSINASQHEGEAVWHFEKYIAGPNRWYRSVIASQEDFFPIKGSSVHSKLGNANVTFEENQITTIFKMGKKSEQITKISKLVYDNEQAQHLVRRLPLAPGYSVTVTVYEPLFNSISDVKISVEGKETLDVPAGSYDCFKLKLAVSKDGAHLDDQFIWVADNSSRYTVKFHTSEATIVLDRIKQMNSEGPILYDFPEHRLSFKTKRDRRVIDISYADDSVAFVLALLNPKFRASKIVLVVIEPGMDPERLMIPENKKKYHIRGLQRKGKEFSLRPDPVATPKVMGQPTVMYVADIKAGKKEMVESRIYFKIGERLCYFAISSKKAMFEKTFAELEGILENFIAH